MITALKNYLQKNNYTKFDLKAVLYDMDGVLYDSMKWHAKSWKEAMDEFEISTQEEEFYLYEGVIGRNTINDIMLRERCRQATEEEIQEIYGRKTELFVEYNDGSLIPYASEFVNKVREAGLTRVVVTGSGQPTLINKLEHSFPNCFKRELMVTAFDVKHGKPHPEPYLMGLEKAGNLKPNQAIVIENAPKGVQAAAAAGIFTIAVNTGPIPDKTLWDAGANVVLASMQALNDSWDAFYKQLI